MSLSPVRNSLRSGLACLVLSLALAATLHARTLCLSRDGSDSAAVAPGARFRTAAAVVPHLAAGDTLLVLNGTYTGGVTVSVRASREAPLVIRGESPAAVIDGSGDEIDALRIQDASWVRLENLTVLHAERSGCAVRHSDHVTISHCRFGDNGVWGIFTSFADNILFEYNECYGSKKQHGIYHSNSGDDFVIRGNLVHDNSGNGIHMNGDPEIHGGDGILNHGLVEGNVVWNNGRTGGAGINMTHVRDVIVRNNLLHHNLAGGITVYQDTGTFGQGSKHVLITGNTVFYAPGQGRTGVNVQTTSEKVAVIGNILVSGGQRGAMEINARNLGSVFSDCNLLWGVGENSIIERRDRHMSLEDWRVFTSNDSASRFADPKFVAPAKADFHLQSGSPAAGLGLTRDQIIPVLVRLGDFDWVIQRLEGLSPLDLDSRPRPADSAPEAGAYQIAR